MLKRISKAKMIIDQYRHQKIVSFWRAIYLWIKNYNHPYQWVDPNDWGNFKQSDTIFIFGSGPSINEITENQWEIIKRHDTFGLNAAFLLNYPTTYYYLGHELSSRNVMLKAFSDKRSLFNDTLWFYQSKSLYRLIHPRIIPEYFPTRVKLAHYNWPPNINLDMDRPFQESDFQQSLSYRNIMSFALHIVDYLGYKNIVLLGVDLDTYGHFYDNYEVMKVEVKDYKNKMSKNVVFESMIPKGNKYRTMEEYYYAVNELYFKNKQTNLFVGNKYNLLSPKIPYYSLFG